MHQSIQIIQLKDKTLEWTSSNPKVATVDENGKVKEIGFGDTTITVKSK